MAFQVNILQLSVKYQQIGSICDDVGIVAFPVNIF
jgi:hypothetical protein